MIPILRTDLLKLLCHSFTEAEGQLVCQTLKLQGVTATISKTTTESELYDALRFDDCDAVLTGFSCREDTVLAALVVSKALKPEAALIVLADGVETTGAALQGGADDCVIKADLHRLSHSLHRAIGFNRMQAAFTEQKRYYEKTAALAVRHEALIKAFGELVYDHDVLNNEIFWDGNLETCTGWSRAELGTTMDGWQSRIHPDDVSRILEELNACGKKSVCACEYRFLCKDGRYIWIYDRCYAMRDEQGRLTRVIGVMVDLTNRRREEEELRARTAFSEALLESSQDGIIVVDAEGKTILQNKRATELWKMPAEIASDVDDKRRVSFVRSKTKNPDEFLQKVLHLYAHPMEKSRDTIELVDGTMLDRSSSPVIDNNGKYYGRVWIFHDITELNYSRRRISDELNFNRTILNAAPCGIICYRSTGETISVNGTAARLIGTGQEQVIGQNFRYLPSWKTSGLLESADRALASLRDCELETKFTTSFGKSVWLHFRFSPFDYAGQQHLLVVLEDIEGRKLAEAKLQESEERFRQFAENIQEVFWMTDELNNRMLYISPGYERIWGRSAQTAIDNPHDWAQAIHPDDRENVLKAAHEKQAKGNYDEIYRVVRPDSTVRWIHDRGFPIRNAAGEVYRVVGVAQDVTEQRRLEEQLRHAQKMEALGTLAGGIAHDFNNILTAINGYTFLAKQSAGESADVVECLNAIGAAGQRAGDLVNQILAFSRRQPQEKKPIQLRHIVREAIKLLQATVPPSITFEVSLSAATNVVLADPSQVHQIVMNLATNAWHAMKDRPGVLNLSLENFHVDEVMAETHPDLRCSDYVCLTVSDTGHGMDRHTLDRIFEPFFTTKALGEGTGLGLAVVHGIIQSHGGAIAVSSKVGVGTKFHIYFPAHYAGRLSEVPEAGPVRTGQGERILFVDDEPALASLGRKALERFGYSVHAVTSPVDAVQAVVDAASPFDLVITDFAMPELLGTDFARQVHEIRPDLPIILMTGYAGSFTREGACALGFKELLVKPLSLEHLGQCVSRVLSAEIASQFDGN